MQVEHVVQRVADDLEKRLRDGSCPPANDESVRELLPALRDRDRWTQVFWGKQGDVVAGDTVVIACRGVHLHRRYLMERCLVFSYQDLQVMFEDAEGEDDA